MLIDGFLTLPDDNHQTTFNHPIVFVHLSLRESQSQRRVFNKEKVPSSEKLVSLFEPLTDIIVKTSRDVAYGHKVNLTLNSGRRICHKNARRQIYSNHPFLGSTSYAE